jgi:hypothetical protein
MSDYIPRHSEQPQIHPSRRWCLRCNGYASMKGGTTKPVFLCAKHKPKERRDAE